MRSLGQLRVASGKVWSGQPLASDALWIVGLALIARLGVVGWAHGHFPPVDDGRFYDIVAARIARGLGYTWLWPDGAVSYAAHYPIGYPALLGGLYAVFGSNPLVAMLFNALVGTLGVWAVQRVTADMGRRGPALVAGLVAAVHPGFVFYTPALMTEGVTAALLAVLAALAVAARRRHGSSRIGSWIVLGVLAGLVALIRPQLVLLAPIFGAFAAPPSGRGRLGGAAVVTALAIAACMPWTLRNCQKLERCVFVSANAGWNLWIGSAERATGRWVAVDVLGVPEECREVFGEAEKDRCFGRAGVRNIRNAPLRFLGLVPEKLGATFDWSGAPAHYLNASNAAKFNRERKLALGAVESVVERLILLFGLLGIGRARGPRRPIRSLLALVGIVWLFQEHAWVAYGLTVLGAGLCGARLLAERPGLALGVSVVAVTALTHAVFFGDARYGLLSGLVVVVLAAEAFHPQNAGLFDWIGVGRRCASGANPPPAGPGPA